MGMKRLRDDLRTRNVLRVKPGPRTSTGIANMDIESDPVRPWSGTLEERNGCYVTSYEPGTRNASEVVVFALATIAGTEPDELLPLHDTVDPDALDELFAPTMDGRPRAGGRVTFTHDGYTVTLGHDGTLAIRSVVDARDAVTEAATKSD